MDAEVVHHWVASAGIVLAVLGAIWKWGFSEALRRHTDVPALEGSIEVKTSPIEGSDDALVLIKSVWSNPSRRRVYLDCQETKVYVYDLSRFDERGVVDLGRGDNEYLYSHAPYENNDYIFFEPGTSSEFVGMFRLPLNRTFGARAYLLMDEERMKQRGVFWFRDTVLSTVTGSKDDTGLKVESPG